MRCKEHGVYLKCRGYAVRKRKNADHGMHEKSIWTAVYSRQFDQRDAENHFAVPDEIMQNPEKYRRHAQQDKQDLRQQGIRRDRVLAGNIKSIEEETFHILEDQKNKEMQ